MIDWWNGRSRREQVLLAIMGLLAAGVLLWFGGFQPLRAAHAEAEQRLARALADEAALRSATDTLRALEAGGPPAVRQGDLQTAIEATALAAGLTLERAQATAEGVQAVASGPTQAIGPWLMAMEQDQSSRVRHLTLLKAEGGQVQADVTFEDLAP